MEALPLPWMNGPPPEETELKNLLAAGEQPERLHAILKTEWNNLENIEALSDEQKRKIIEKATGRQDEIYTPATHRTQLWRMTWFRYAAAVVLIAGGTWLFLKKNNASKESITPALSGTPVLPGKAGAILTLADGKQVVLDSLGDGIIASQPGTVLALDNGQLSYKPDNRTTIATTTFNTMSTPPGRQFQLQLPDGTRAWLNAASSIRFPVGFRNDERVVSVTGEVYFEIAKDPRKPFRVFTNSNTAIEVLGTRFNVNVYTDEPGVRTTLLEGAVKVFALDNNNRFTTNHKLLSPGQQAIHSVSDPSAPIIVQQVDTDQVIAWKNGLFNFEGKKLDEVMRQLARWYNIDVVYEKGVPDIVFGGKIERALSISDVLGILKASNVNFRMEGRKIIITH